VRDQQVDNALDTVVVGFSRMLLARDVRHIAQQQCIMRLLSGLSPEHRDVAQSLDRIDFLLEVLRGQKIVVAGFGIDPDRWCDHLIRSQRGDHVANHIALVEAEARGLDAIDVDLEGWIVGLLGDERTGHRIERLDDFVGSACGAKQFRIVRARKLHIDRGGEAEVEHRVDNAAGGEEGFRFGNFLGQRRLEASNVFEGRNAMIAFQRNHQKA
jgi:hypothetical protein